MHSSTVLREWMERKFNWIRKQLGLSKVELARHLGISCQSLYRCMWDGTQRHVALAMLGLWYQDRMGGLLEELSEPEEETTRNQKAAREIVAPSQGVSTSKAC